MCTWSHFYNSIDQISAGFQRVTIDLRDDVIDGDARLFRAGVGKNFSHDGTCRRIVDEDSQDAALLFDFSWRDTHDTDCDRV